MTGLVLGDVGEDLAEEVATGGGADVDEGAEGEPFENHLHADGLGLPERRLHDFAEDGLERGLNGIDLVELADVAAEDLGVTRFVHRLRGGVELGFVVGDGGDELSGDHQRALLAMEELAEDPGGVVGVERLAFAL